MFLLSYLVNKLPPSLASVESRSCDGRELDFEQLSDKRLKSRPKFSDAKASLGDKAESGRHNHTSRDPGMQYRTVVNAVATEHGRPSLWPWSDAVHLNNRRESAVHGRRLMLSISHRTTIVSQLGTTVAATRSFLQPSPEVAPTTWLLRPQ